MLPSGSEEVRGPHATLAVKLVQRDPGRTFVLGERIPYVLLSGECSSAMHAFQQTQALLSCQLCPGASAAAVTCAFGQNLSDHSLLACRAPQHVPPWYAPVVCRSSKWPLHVLVAALMK